MSDNYAVCRNCGSAIMDSDGTNRGWNHVGSGNFVCPPSTPGGYAEPLPITPAIQDLISELQDMVQWIIAEDPDTRDIVFELKDTIATYESQR